MSGHEREGDDGDANVRTRAEHRALLALCVMAASGLAVTASRPSAAPVTIDLCAVPGTAPLPGAGTRARLGLRHCRRTPGDCTTATARVARAACSRSTRATWSRSTSPTRCRRHGPTTMRSRSRSRASTFDPGPTDAAVGDSVTVSFTASAPGTYLYQSGGDAGRQEAMGLYGRADRAADHCQPGVRQSPATAYDVEAIAGARARSTRRSTPTPDTFDMHDYRATYWLINGKAYPDDGPAITAPRRASGCCCATSTPATTTPR